MRAVLVGVLYAAAYQYAVFLRDPEHLGASFWPGAGLTVGALLLSSRRHWPAILAAVGAVHLVSALGGGLAAGLLTTTANLMVAGGGAWLLQRCDATRLRTLGALMRFSVVVVVVTLAAALIGALGIQAAGTPFPYGLLVAQWVAGDAVGILTLTPALLVLSEPAARRRLARPQVVGALVVVGAITALVFAFEGAPLLYLVLLPLVWATVRLGPLGAALSVLVMAQVVNLLHALDRGVIAATADGEDARWQVQLFLATVSLAALGLAALLAELRERDEAQARLRHQAQHDALTGLPNRAALTEHLDEVLSRAGPRSQVRLLLCDLDGFKDVNDRYGHAAGDTVLREVAQRLSTSLRPGDVLARFGGDEFVACLEGVAEPDVDEIVGRLVAAAEQPIAQDHGAAVEVGLSVGVARALPEGDAGALLREADAAMYRSKRQRGAAWAEGPPRVQRLERLVAPGDLPDALAGSELFCRHQPAVDLQVGAPVVIESLLRWRHAERGLVRPAELVAGAEHAGLSARLFDYVLERTLEAHRGWVEALGWSPPVSVNLSTRQLHDGALVERLGQALERSGTPASALWVEVGEGSVADPASLEVLGALREQGVAVVLDDLGGGPDALSILAAFPWTLAKLDRGLLQAAGQAEAAPTSTLRALVAAASAIEVRTVAKGLERPAHLQTAHAVGCSLGQGNLLVAPRAPEEVRDDLAVPPPGPYASVLTALAGGRG